ncbi:MAG: molybdopterin dehydrogenase FAD-binding protein [Paucimonas sp.]|nr:molybdopterin dehydrogenase FAD-binding protein [Paucimonas sp.]
MKPPKFEYHGPRSQPEVLSLLASYGEDARILAGGQSLVPLLNFRVVQPRALVSINHCPELSYVRTDGDALRIGALLRQCEAEHSADVKRDCPLLAAALPWVGSTSNRNRGTVCGSLAHADPLAELTAVAVALDATFILASATGTREVPASEFFVSDLTTCIAPGEMLESVKFPRCGPDASAAFVEVGNRWHGFAVVGLAAHLEFESDGRCKSARLAAIGMGSTPVRLRAAEDLLRGARCDSAAVGEAAALAARDLDPPGGFHADAAYKLDVVGTLLERAVAQAWHQRSNRKQS